MLAPVSKDEDSRRQEFITTLLSLGSLCLGLVALLNVINNYFNNPTPERVRTITLLCFSSLGFLVLYRLSRRAHYRLAAAILVSLFFLLGTFALYVWSISLPAGLITYALVIIMSGIMLGSRASLLVTLGCWVSLLTIGYLQQHGIGHPTRVWALNLPTVSDGIGFAVELSIIATVSWLSNRELERSLKRARRSEAALKKERDQLEVTVEKRTNALRQAQVENMLEVSRFAEWGRLASGIFHDLVNPLTAVSLNLEQLGSAEDSETLRRAIEGTKTMERFLVSARKQIRDQKELTSFSLIAETQEVLNILSHKAAKFQVKLTLEGNPDIKTTASAVGFYQVLSNLVSNAIEAYDGMDKADRREVVVRIAGTGQEATISVQDWGKGIKTEDLAHIFDLFFSTKAGKGTGIGLLTTKEVVTRQLGGTIAVESEVGKGTVFTVKFPLIPA